MVYANLFHQFNDESFTLQLQLEENEAQRELQSGKQTEDHRLDFVLVFDNFHAELKKAIFLVEDLKFAHSTAKAVDSNAVAIKALRVEETQSRQDRDFALSLNKDKDLPFQDITKLLKIPRLEAESVNWQYILRTIETSTFSIESCNTVADPSANYALRQRAVLEYLPQLKVEYSICREAVHPYTTVRLVYSDIYCKPCLKSFFLRVAKDESLFLPICYRQLIDISTIEADFSVDKLTAYRSAELEFTSTDRVYCASPECAKFIPIPQRTADYTSCKACGTRTCMYYKALVYNGGCPADEVRQSLINFANE